jgi:hypothetical protein
LFLAGNLRIFEKEKSISLPKEGVEEAILS